MSRIHFVAALFVCLLLSSFFPKILAEVDEDEYEDVFLDEEEETNEGEEAASNDVVVLTQSNFDEIIEKTPYVLVRFKLISK